MLGRVVPEWTAVDVGERYNFGLVHGHAGGDEELESILMFIWWYLGLFALQELNIERIGVTVSLRQMIS